MPHIFVVLEDGRPLHAYRQKSAAYEFVVSVMHDEQTAKHAYCVRSVELFGDEESTAQDDHEMGERMPFLRRYL